MPRFSRAAGHQELEEDHLVEVQVPVLEVKVEVALRVLSRVNVNRFRPRAHGSSQKKYPRHRRAELARRVVVLCRRWTCTADNLRRGWFDQTPSGTPDRKLGPGGTLSSVV